MSKRGENIYKRKDGRWEGRYIRIYDENGKAKYGYVYAATYREAKQKLEVKKGAKKDAQIDSTPGSNMPYGKLLDGWLQFTCVNIKESTHARYFCLVETHIRPALGKYPVCKISTQLLEEFIREQLRWGRLDGTGGLSPKTVTDILMIIKNSMEYARDNGINITCNLQKLTVKKKDKEIRVFTQSEQSALVNVLLNDIDRYKFGVLLSLYTGIRIGELCALLWEDVSIPAATLKVRKTMQRIQNIDAGAATKTRVIITEPKSQCSIRDIPLPQFIVEIAERFADHPKAFLLSGDKYRYIEPRTMQNHFKTYIKESGINDANYHTLRHTFATRCIEVGFEIKTLSEILGHANVNITLNRYVHSSFDLKCANMNKLLPPD